MRSPKATRSPVTSRSAWVYSDIADFEHRAETLWGRLPPDADWRRRHALTAVVRHPEVAD